MKKSVLQLITLFTAALSFVACKNSGPKQMPLELAQWLKGTWQQSSPSGNLIEYWEQQNDSVLTGYSYYIIQTDTVSSELLRIEQHDQTLSYIPTVEDQNNNQPVVFTSTSLSDTTLVFKNPTHDFPQKITYRKINQDSLVAEISGNMQGTFRSVPFYLKRLTN